MAKKDSDPIVLEGEEPAGKQKRLIDDPAIEEIEDAALNYAQVRDKRIAASRKEIDAKDTLLAALKKHKKKHYHRANIDCEIVPEGERLKVKITDDED